MRLYELAFNLESSPLTPLPCQCFAHAPPALRFIQNYATNYGDFAFNNAYAVRKLVRISWFVDLANTTGKFSLYRTGQGRS